MSLFGELYVGVREVEGSVVDGLSSHLVWFGGRLVAPFKWGHFNNHGGGDDE